MSDPDLGLILDSLPSRRGRRSALEVAYETVRYAILTGALQGGSRLVQSTLADSLGVSTTPVREALRDLASEGLVDLDQHRGAVVRTVGFPEAYDIYCLRSVLEPLVVRRATKRISPEELDLLDGLCDDMDAVNEPQQYVELNIRFHGLILEAAQFPLLDGFLRSLQAKAAIYVGGSIVFDFTDGNVGFWPVEMRRGNEEHRAIVTAFRTSDTELAAHLMEQHVVATLHNIDAHRLDREPGSEPSARAGTDDTRQV